MAFTQKPSSTFKSSYNCCDINSLDTNDIARFAHVDSPSTSIYVTYIVSAKNCCASQPKRKWKIQCAAKRQRINVFNC